jgi:hypothetical protein
MDGEDRRALILNRSQEPVLARLKLEDWLTPNVLTVSLVSRANGAYSVVTSVSASIAMHGVLLEESIRIVIAFSTGIFAWFLVVNSLLNGIAAGIAAGIAGGIVGIILDRYRIVSSPYAAFLAGPSITVVGAILAMRIRRRVAASRVSIR